MAARPGPILAAALVALTALAIPARPCGPDIPEAVFVSPRHPDAPLASYADGKLGILLPSYYQRYLYVAYRALAGRPLTTAEAMRSMTIPPPSLGASSDDAQRWLRARAEALSAPNPGWITTDCAKQMGDQFLYFPNIYGDAFRNAEATLRDRIRSEGRVTDAVRDWIRAQDAVFGACLEGAQPPPAAPADSPAWLVRDRAYQTAAWNFYSVHYDQALNGFRAIAADQASPWKSIAPYLMGRTYLRQGTVSAGYRQYDAEALRAAETQFEAVIRDSRDANLRHSAERLLDFTRFRLHPVERLGQLGRALSAEHSPRDLDQMVFDFTVLLDRFQPAQVESLARASADYALADWILSFQAGDYPHALQRWRATQSAPWLVAALSSAPAGGPDTDELIAAARSVKPSDAAFASVTFHHARLLAGSGRGSMAALLSRQDRFPPSSWSLVRALRMQHSSGFDEFIDFAERPPAGISTWLDVRTEPLAPPTDRDPLFDTDGALMLNRWTPLERLVEAATGSRLTDSLRARVRLAAWTKAVVLERHDVAVRLAPPLASAYASLAPYLSRYHAAAVADRPFEAAWTLLQAPGASPWVRWGLGRMDPPEERNVYRDNWWCVAEDHQSAWFLAPPDMPEAPTRWVRSPGWDEKLARAIYSPAERTTAKNELTRLMRAGPGPNFLCSQTLRWAKQRPSDPRLPEALHLAVMATRYGCADRRTTQWSKQAFQTLHRRYPKSEWARRTKYWY